MSNAVEIDIAIVGGGIIGLWTAYELLSQNSNLQVAVFEQEMYLGEHTTTRNSEVLHAGIYYENNSLKHIHCLAGNGLWRRFVQDFSIPFLDCGKFIVAQSDEIAHLHNLEKKASENQVPGMREASQAEIDSLKPFIRVDKALYSQSSGVLDISSSLKRLRHEIESLGGMIITHNKAVIKTYSDHLFILRVNEDLIQSKFLVNAAGLHAVDFRKALGLTEFTNYYVKGNYLQFSGQYPAKNLIYPIPPKHGLGLGVHLTLDSQGQAKFGPNTFPVEKIQYDVPVETKDQMLKDIQRLFYTVQESQLSLGYSGIRPKVKKDGILMKDFILQTSQNHGINGYIELLGVESPGLTAAPSLAKLVATTILS